MAEYGVHHATTGVNKPSVFEVIGQDNLVSGLRAAFRHIFKVLADNYPEKCGLLYRYFDEGYTVVDSVFQYIHLRLRGGLFTETFYGLKRVPDPRILDVSKQKVIVWVILAVVCPYLQSQLDALYKNFSDKWFEGSLTRKDLKTRLAVLYLKVYPFYNFLSEMTILGYYMAYALGKTDFHSPSLHLTSTKLVPLIFNDFSSDAWKRYIPKDQLKSYPVIVWKWINVLVGGVTLSVSIGAFLTQFLEWWYNREGQPSTFAALPVPPPPPKWPCETPIDICPICKEPRTNDTALSSSGFVFCYPCIHQYVEMTNKCPVTGYRSSLKQLIKLYHQE
ncbi:peroxisome assembly protein 12-like isoform X1 [Stegodyphus dumicola]|uniref:peroxisome assembly protein 12-like isoform X1 n=1 Tax=Stegodyphus dumicola TaxID=202533 RepID=UPI0015A814DE|nr:peroxisome assembly protein 12-like isoform X1 [Stegodyphus dumicola]